jgi:hypothetical protein
MRRLDIYARDTEEVKSFHEHGPPGCSTKSWTRVENQRQSVDCEQSPMQSGFGPPRIPALRL